MPTNNRKSKYCLNCSYGLDEADNYCPKCGQENLDKNISFGQLIKDFLGDYFTFDSKFFKSIIPLLFKPGKVPLDFVQGKRAKYIPPLRILIFSSFIFFLMLGLTNFFSSTNTSLATINIDGKETQIGINSGKVFLQSIPDSLLDAAINDTTGQSFGVHYMKAIKMSKQGMSVDTIVYVLANDMGKWDKFRFRQSVKIMQSSPANIMQQFLNNLPITLLILQPIFALLLWIVYIRNRKKHFYIGHLVLSTYLHAIVLIGMIPFLIITKLTGAQWIWLVAFAFYLIYFLIALKTFYKQNWLKTILKFLMVMCSFTLVIIPISLIMAFLVGLIFV